MVEGLTVEQYRANYARALQTAKAYGKLTPARFKAQVKDRLTRQGIATPTPCQWAWEAQVYAEDLREGYCDSEYTRRMDPIED